MATGRASFLDVSVFSLGGDFLGLCRGFDLEYSASTDDDNETLPMRWERGVLLGQATTLRATLNRGTAPSWKSSLDVSAFTIGGTDYLGNIERGRIRVATRIRDVRAVNELHEYPQALRTAIAVEGDLMYTGTDDRALFLLLDDSDPSGRSLNLSLTVDGDTLAGPFVLTTVRHSTRGDEVQTYSVELVHEGSLAVNGGLTAVPVSSLLASIISGTAVVAVQIKTSAALGAGYDISGNAVITEAVVSFDRGRVTTDEFTLQFQGAPTISNA